MSGESAKGAETRCALFRDEGRIYCANSGKSFSDDENVNADRCSKCSAKQIKMPESSWTNVQNI